MTSEQDKPRTALASARTNPFRRSRKVIPLAPEDAQRQGAISALAFQLLGGRDAALDFLHTEDTILSGRPIAVALRDGSALDIAEQARLEGVRSLRESGLHKARQGLTSLYKDGE